MLFGSMLLTISSGQFIPTSGSLLPLFILTFASDDVTHGVFTATMKAAA